MYFWIKKNSSNQKFSKTFIKKTIAVWKNALVFCFRRCFGSKADYVRLLIHEFSPGLFFQIPLIISNFLVISFTIVSYKKMQIVWNYIISKFHQINYFINSNNVVSSWQDVVSFERIQCLHNMMFDTINDKVLVIIKILYTHSLYQNNNKNYEWLLFYHDTWIFREYFSPFSYDF